MVCYMQILVRPAPILNTILDNTNNNKCLFAIKIYAIDTDIVCKRYMYGQEMKPREITGKMREQRY